MKGQLLVGIMVLFLIACGVVYVLMSRPKQRAAPTANDASRLPGEVVTGEAVTTSSGLKYYDLKQGAGPTPPSSSSKVKVHYTGWLLNGKKFDSSVDRGQPTEFVLKDVVAGWTEGVGTMKVGGKRKLVIPYNLAYGERGRPPSIPPRATLVFDIELIDIVD